MERRAKTKDDKQLKYQMILDATARLFREERKLHTAAQIAEEAQIAKGTLYIYFKSKEEIYMQLLVSTFENWHIAVRAYLEDNRPTCQELIEYLCHSLVDYTVSVDLMSLAAIAVEENLAVEPLRQGRAKMREQTLLTAEKISEQFPKWNRLEAAKNLRRFYTYGIGFWRECFPSTKVLAALPETYGNEEERKKLFYDEVLYFSGLIWGAKDQ